MPLVSISFDVMLNKIKEMIRVLPAHMAAVVRHACLTGLRPAEAVESVRPLLASGIYQTGITTTQNVKHFNTFAFQMFF
jgi:hypothetical protein